MERIVVLSSLYEEIKMGWRFGKIKDLFFRWVPPVKENQKRQNQWASNRSWKKLVS
jgi:hypothetical protein